MPRNTSEIFMGGVARRDIAGTHLSDPRDSGRVLGRPVTLSEPQQPDPVTFPGWTITPFVIDGDTTMDGCVFDVPAGTRTPVGAVEYPEGHDKNKDPYPHFEEFAARGEAIALLGTSNSAQIRRVGPETGSLLYGPPTRVLYIAGREPFVGINISRPAGVPERSIELSDSSVPAGMRELYRKIPQPVQPRP